MIGAGDFTSLASLQALNTECAGDTGTVEVLNARVFNSTQPLNDSNVTPNESLLPEQLAPLIKITLNRQTPKADGSFTVDGAVLELGGQEVAVLASTTCGEPIPAGNGGGNGGGGGRPPAAPAPEPVQRNLAVTG